MSRDKGYSKREFRVTVRGVDVGKLFTFPEATARAERVISSGQPGFKGWVIISKVYESGRSTVIASWKDGKRERAR